jgi:hypothetical protein
LFLPAFLSRCLPFPRRQTLLLRRARDVPFITQRLVAKCIQKVTQILASRIFSILPVAESTKLRAESRTLDHSGARTQTARRHCLFAAAQLRCFLSHYYTGEPLSRGLFSRWREAQEPARYAAVDPTRITTRKPTHFPCHVALSFATSFSTRSTNLGAE